MSIRAWFDSLLRSRAPSEQAAAAQVNERAAAMATKPAFDDGLAAYRKGDFAHAIECFNAVLERRHDDADAHNNLGLSHLATGNLEEAIDEFVLAAHFRPGYAQAHYNLALGELQRRNYADAVRALERAIGINPAYAAAHNALGYVLTHQTDDFARGALHIRQALQLNPDDPDTLCNYSAVLTQEGRSDEALQICERLMAAHPDMHEARLNRAMVRLRRMQFDAGWPDYEARKLAGGNYRPRALTLPEWREERLAGKTLLIYAEQGIGDQIMFASCVPDALQTGANCVIECAPQLTQLFARSFPRAQIVAEQSDAALLQRAATVGADYQIALGSLPLAFRKQRGEFPGAAYLVAEPARIAHWKNRLAALGPGLKVGISWAGGASSTRASTRSTALGQWAPIFANRRCQFVSLQYGDASAQLKQANSPVHDWSRELASYDDTAALVSALDVIVTVQTALVHLAGALGRRAWVLVQAACEWRYGESGESMPWYSSVRLMRQMQQNEWAPVLERVARELDSLAAS